MAKLQTTCWTMIAAAAAGRKDEQERFVSVYGNAIRDFFMARIGRGTPILDLEDAVQEVYLVCLREGGALKNANPHRPGGFRPFLFGIARNVARRMEAQLLARREVRPISEVSRSGRPDPDADPRLKFERSWARSMVREARVRLEERAREGDEASRRRLELLRLRFEEDLPVREIATRWKEPAQRLHHELHRAKKAFREALREVVAYHVPGTESEIDQECRTLLHHLSKRRGKPDRMEARKRATD